MKAAALPGIGAPSIKSRDVVYESQGAEFDPERRYRYSLHRMWGGGSLSDWRTVCWIMLNPSTADERVLDPTLRRCQRYTLDWGFDGFEVVNLFAWRSTDRRALRHVDDPVGPENDRYIAQAIERNELVIAAWGTHGTLKNRASVVTEQLRTTAKKACCLRKTEGGHPEHPLYLPRLLKPGYLF